MGLGRRLEAAAAASGFALPAAGTVAVFAPRRGADLSGLPVERCRIVTGSRVDGDHFERMGYAVATDPGCEHAAAIVCVARAHGRTMSLIAAAAAATDGPVAIDGAKTDGIESVLRECRRRAEVAGPVSRAHGKLFWLQGGGDFAEWAAAGAPRRIEGGFVARPGVFSADGIDPGSRLLAESLPQSLGACVVDLGAGWGYLSHRVLERGDVREMHMVEEDHAALECARANVADPRTRAHWADAAQWRPEAPVDSVVSNLPFHAGRRADPSLGRAFLAAAARMVKPQGRVFVVANRHLPYEGEMARLFAEVGAAAEDGGYKCLVGARPRRRIKEAG